MKFDHFVRVKLNSTNDIARVVVTNRKEYQRRILGSTLTVVLIGKSSTPLKFADTWGISSFSFEIDSTAVTIKAPIPAALNGKYIKNYANNVMYFVTEGQLCNVTEAQYVSAGYPDYLGANDDTYASMAPVAANCTLPAANTGTYFVIRRPAALGGNHLLNLAEFAAYDDSNQLIPVAPSDVFMSSVQGGDGPANFVDGKNNTIIHSCFSGCVSDIFLFLGG